MEDGGRIKLQKFAIAPAFCPIRPSMGESDGCLSLPLFPLRPAVIA
jgi:hypothetical protein